MKKRMWFLLSTAGLVLLLFSLPTNSRADTIQEHQAGLLNSQGHGVGLLTATQNAAYDFASSAVFHFGGKEANPGKMGNLVGSETDAGRAPFGASDESRSSNVWTGTSYVFGNSGDHSEHNGDNNGNHYGENNGNNGNNGNHYGENNGNNNGNDQNYGNDNNNSSMPVPEPATYLLLATGLVGLLVYRRFSDVDL